MRALPGRRAEIWRLAGWLVLLGCAALYVWRPWFLRPFSVSHPPDELFLRVFKHEGVLEAWGRRGLAPFQLIKSYPITAASGGPGPKRKEGDLQVPEGFYQVDRFNPQSSFHLSMGLNYPNAADKILGDPERPGFDIYIHGGAMSVGCVPLGDAGVEEVYRLAEATARRGRPIAVHIFPARMQGAAWERYAAEFPQFTSFWRELQPAFLAFEQGRQLPEIAVTGQGRYQIVPASAEPR